MERSSGPLLGVAIEPYDGDANSGVLIRRVIEESAAEKAGLLKGDVIVGVNDITITTGKQLREVIQDQEAGETVTVKFVRNGVERSKEATLKESGHRVFMKRIGPGGPRNFHFEGDMDELMERLKEMDDIDIDLDFDMDLNLFEDQGAFLGVTPSAEQGKEGVILGSVIDGSAAEKMGLESGDEVMSIDEQKVADFDALAEIIAARNAGDEVEIVYARDGKREHVQGFLGKRKNHVQRHIMKGLAPDCHVGISAGPWTDNLMKEISVVIGLKDCTTEEEEMLEEKAGVDFDKDLALRAIEIEFYPNPNAGQFQLAFKLKKKEPARVLVFDQTGRAVYEETLADFDGRYRNTIDISDQPVGTYFLIVAQGQKQFTRKFVKN